MTACSGLRHHTDHTNAWFTEHRVMRVTLLVPDVLWGRADDTQLFARLSTLPAAAELARQEPERLPYQPSEALLAARCCAKDAAGSDLAVLRLAGETGADEYTLRSGAALFCADPVHLRFHQEFLIAADESQIELRPEETAQLVAALNEHFGDRARFWAISPARWYLELADAPSESWPPLAEIVGRSLSPRLFAPAALQQIGSEAQMLLHAHPVNQRREAEGRPTANGVWLWGRLSQLASEPTASGKPDRIIGDGPLATGIARTLGIPSFADDDAAAGQASANSLIVVDALRAAASLEAADEYERAWQILARRWLEPLLENWRRGEIGGIELISPCPAYGTLVWRWDKRPGFLSRMLRVVREGRRAPDLQAAARRLAKERSP